MKQPTSPRPQGIATVRSVAELRRRVAEARAAGLDVGLVPTMGALHDGHLSLVRRARERSGLVVVSLFVNPAQFNESSDLERYPRDPEHDTELARAAGADILFAPSVAEVYPRGFATSVEVDGPLTSRLEGASRGAAHFRGVTTVVAKLLGIVQPDVAYFGQKDAQQVLVVRRMVADLNIPVRIEALPTVRDRDGLALSSRNALLSRPERKRALALSGALTAARELTASGERSAAAILAAAGAVLAAAGVEPEYCEIVDPDTLEGLELLERDALLALAARVGDVRLIDNTILRPAPVRERDLPLPEGVASTCSA
jgi:pantoate--beta-alanine ligase